MAKLDTNTSANRELGRETDAMRSWAADLQREEVAGRMPAGTADAFRRHMALVIRTARLATIRNPESGNRFGAA